MAEKSDGVPSYLDIDGTIDRLGLDRSIYLGLLRTYKGKFSDAHAHLDGLIKAGDIETAASYAHNVKGVSGNIGADTLSRAAANVEAVLKSGNVPDGDLVDKFGAANAGTLQAIETEIQPVQQDTASGAPAGSVDAVTFKAGYDTLAGALDRSSFDARDIAADVVSSLNGAYSSEAGKLLDAIESLDFATAKRRLEILAAMIEIDAKT
ncbi:MAG: Hpt domain-containing protein [Alphaproteobacteria bacterium]